MKMNEPKSLFRFLKRGDGIFAHSLYLLQNKLKQKVKLIMPELNASENDFLNRLTEVILENISDEKFGVSELAGAIGMSRSNLLRKVQKLSKLSVSQFIRQIRLRQSMELLKQNTFTVSEVTFEVGFSSTSYFIKCFREYYGYPPGEVGKRDTVQNNSTTTNRVGKKRRIIRFVLPILILLAIGLFLLLKPKAPELSLEKSIAVLPFKNDSNDSTNVYIINGLMESILNNLQQIEDLRVISRTSVEKYRNTTKTIPEIAKELNVNYFVEGSGQKIGEKLLLNVQLIKAPTEDHLWAEQYSREAKDVFDLQMEVAKNIAGKIEAIITPEEEERINKIPTEDLVAYDYFLKALDLMNVGNRESLEKAIPYLDQAVEQDNEFARAYAALAMAYYYLDIFRAEKKYTEQINYNADKALFYDSKLTQSLVAKAYYYMHVYEYDKALPYLEKALDYNPNSAMVINILSDFYTSYIPNSEKYLEYALKGVELDIASNDSVTASFIYLHLSNAFIQSGFTDEAITYINKSLEYNPDNLFSAYVKAYVLYAKNKNLQLTKNLLLETFSRDTSRLDIMQEIGNVYYYQRDYDSAYFYFKKFEDIKAAQNLTIYIHKSLQIGYVYSKMGKQEEAERFYKAYLDYAENDNSIYKHLSLAMYYANANNTPKAIEHLKLFAKEDNYHYWTILFVEMDPLVDTIKDNPEFKKVMKELKNKFWRKHKRINVSLKKKELL